MHYDKGIIVLNAIDLDLASKCPFSLTLRDELDLDKECVRCNAFRQIARYCLGRSFRSTNISSEKHLKNKYNTILSEAGIASEERGTMTRQDAGILAEILHFSKQYRHDVDLVQPDINLNFGRFAVRDTIDATLRTNGKYYITKFMCDDHDLYESDMVCHETVIGSLWVRETYTDVEENGICFVQLSRTNPPLMRHAAMIPSTEQLRGSIQSIIDYLEPKEPIKNERAFKTYQKTQLKKLPFRYGNQCLRLCQYCFKF